MYSEESNAREYCILHYINNGGHSRSFVRLQIRLGKGGRRATSNNC